MPDRSVGRVAFVPPRYGVEIVGGSEAVMREAAHGLAARGWDVEVLTTCARDHYTWHNEYPAGTTTDGDVVVHRFKVEGSKPKRWRSRIEARIQSGQPVSLADQLKWLDGLFRVPALFHHLVVNADRYDAVILSPYLFWTTVTGITVVPERTIVMPCLHDEPYAYLDVLKPVLADVARLWFLSEPEHQLAHRCAVLRRTMSPVPACTSPIATTPKDFAPDTTSSDRSSCSPAGANGARAGTGCSPRSTSPFASTSCPSTS